MSPDWSAKEEPVPYATMDDPQSLNLYSYVRNNPLSRFDPDGHNGFTDWWKSLWNKIRYGEFTTDSRGAEIRHLDRQEAKHRLMSRYREEMKKHPPKIMVGIVGPAELAPFIPQLLRRMTPLKPLHSGDVLEKDSDINSIRQMSTEEITDSLKPGSKEPLKVKADGTVMDGNTRLRVLQERGVETENLPRVPYESEPINAPWEEIPPE